MAKAKGSDKERVLKAVKDKKVKGGQMTFILARGIGKAFVTSDVPADELSAFMEGAIAA